MDDLGRFCKDAVATTYLLQRPRAELHLYIQDLQVPAPLLLGLDLGLEMLPFAF